MSKQVITLHFPDSKDWTLWLWENYKKVISIDMFFYKKYTGIKTIPYTEAVETALCFGWIDGRIKKIDENKYVRRFSRRSPKSKWSLLNQKRMEKMIRENKVLLEVKQSYEKARKDGLFQSEEEKTRLKEMIVEIPVELKEKLKESEKAKEFFYTLNKRSLNAYCLFIKEPKKEETRKKRLNEMIWKLEQHLLNITIGPQRMLRRAGYCPISGQKNNRAGKTLTEQEYYGTERPELPM